MKLKFEKDIIFHINIDLLHKLISCVDKAFPNEATGLLFGNIEQVNLKNDFLYHYYVKNFKCTESSHKSPVAFLLDNDELLFKISYKIEKEEGLNVIGIFHSHPSETYPSSVDNYYMKIFYDSGILKFKHLIWVIMDSESKESMAFVFLKGELTQISLKID
jgi:proteasome lid subunit RPN8/RPN11